MRLDGEEDEDYAVEVRSRFPRGVTSFEGEYPVAGVSKRQDVLVRYIDGTDRRLVLIPEPENEYDPNAIRIDAIWREPDGSHLQGTLGYVPREHAAILAQRNEHLQLHARPVVLFRGREGRYAGIRVAFGWSIDEAGVRRQAARRSRRRTRPAAPNGCTGILMAALAVAALVAAASITLALSGCATIPQVRAELASSFAKFRAEEAGVLTSRERDWVAVIGIAIAIASGAAGLLRWATARRRRRSRDAFKV